MKTGIELIAKERQRQIKEEMFDADHDGGHTEQSLADAAVCFAASQRVFFLDDHGGDDIEFIDPWPVHWDGRWDKRGEYGRRNKQGLLPDPKTYTKKQRKDLLVKAGALIAAEIDRLNRASGKNR